MICAILLLSGIVGAVPQVALPINSQVPPIARIDHDYNFQFSDSTFAHSASDNVTYTLEGAPQWLSLHPSSREFSGTPHANDVGSSSFQLRASDLDGSVAAPVTLIVSEYPSPALAIDVSAALESAGLCSDEKRLALYQNTPFQFTLSAGVESNKPDGVIYYATSTDRSPLPSWISFNDKDIEFEGTTPQPVYAPQTYTFLLIASTVEGFEEWSTTFSLAVGMHQLAFRKVHQIAERLQGGDLTVDSLLDQLLLDGRSISSTDIAGAWANVPPGLSFDPISLTFKGRDFKSNGLKTITVTVKDAYDDLASTNISLERFEAGSGDDVPQAGDTSTPNTSAPTTSSEEISHSSAAAVTPKAGSNNLSPGDIVAAVVVPIIVVFVCILCLLLRRRRQKRDQQEDDDSLPDMQECWVSAPAVGSVPKLQLKYHDEYLNDGVSSNQISGSQFEDVSNDYSTLSSVTRGSQAPSVRVVARVSTHQGSMASSRRSTRNSWTSSFRRARRSKKGRRIQSHLSPGPLSERRLTGFGHGRTDMGPPRLTGSAGVFARTRRTQSTLVTTSASSFASGIPQGPAIRNQSLRRHLSRLGRGNTIRLVTASDMTSSRVGTSERENEIIGGEASTPEHQLQDFDKERQKYLKSRGKISSRPLFGSCESPASQSLRKTSTPRKPSMNPQGEARTGPGGDIGAAEESSSPSLLYPRVIEPSCEALDRFGTPDSGSRYSNSTHMDYGEYEEDGRISIIEEHTQAGASEHEEGKEDDAEQSVRLINRHSQGARSLLEERETASRSKYTSGQSSAWRQSIFHEAVDDSEDGRGSESPRLL